MSDLSGFAVPEFILAPFRKPDGTLDYDAMGSGADEEDTCCPCCGHPY